MDTPSQREFHNICIIYHFTVHTSSKSNEGGVEEKRNLTISLSKKIKKHLLIHVENYIFHVQKSRYINHQFL